MKSARVLSVDSASSGMNLLLLVLIHWSVHAGVLK